LIITLGAASLAGLTGGCASDAPAETPSVISSVQSVAAPQESRGIFANASPTPPAAATKSAVTQLDFFDHLDSRPVVSWDEMLAAILLAANRDASPSYAARLQQARSFGIVGPEAPVDGRTPATPAAFARTLLRAQGQAIPPGIDSTEVVNLAVARKLLPRSVRANDLLSGSTVVQALASAGEPVKKIAAEPRPGATASSTPLARSTSTPPRQPVPASTLPATTPPAARQPGVATTAPKPATPPPSASSSVDAFAEFEGAPGGSGSPSASPPAPSPASSPSTSSPPAPSPPASSPGTSNPKPKQPINPALPQPRPEPLPPSSPASTGK
jgi:hypothetical protein